MTDFLDQATELVDLIQAQNWKAGGVLIVDRLEAIALLDQALRAAHTGGVADGAKATGDLMLQTFDAVTGAQRQEG